MDVIKLFQTKNRCLKKFLEVSTSLVNFLEKGDFSTLKEAESKREAILKAMELYDRKISETISLLSSSEKTADLKKSVMQELQTKTSLIELILKTEKKIVSSIEIEKEKIHKEILSTEKNKSMVKKFKSSWVAESGEGVDTKL